MFVHRLTSLQSTLPSFFDNSVFVGLDNELNVDLYRYYYETLCFRHLCVTCGLSRNSYVLYPWLHSCCGEWEGGIFKISKPHQFGNEGYSNWHPKSVRNRWVIECFGEVFVLATVPANIGACATLLCKNSSFSLCIWYDIFQILQISHTLLMYMLYCTVKTLRFCACAKLRALPRVFLSCNFGFSDFLDNGNFLPL